MTEPLFSPTQEISHSTTDFQNAVDWAEVARFVLASRTLDDLEEQELVPKGIVRYQFSARGHELAQVLLGLRLNQLHDAASVYYRSRPFMLSQGMTITEGLASSMARVDSLSGGRDVGAVYNMPRRECATILPMVGDVGGQYSPAAGWAQTIAYHQSVLQDKAWQNTAAVVFGGDGSLATPGFWSSFNMATTLKLPLLFFIEDNGYAISVPSVMQVPNGDIMANFASYQNVLLLSGDGTDPIDAATKIDQSLDHIRSSRGPVLLRLKVPRLNGHSITDTQAYKDEATKEAERQRDPIPRLRAFMLEQGWSEAQWEALVTQVEQDVRKELEHALASPEPDPATSSQFMFSDPAHPQKAGGVGNYQPVVASSGSQAATGPRINMIDAVRQTLTHELETNPRMLVFGEDVGRKGGVHGATRDLQHQFGEGRVFDTSLSEEGIIGRAVGMALAGLLPVPEIQFRKYADPAMEQITNCGALRWRSNNNFAAPLVVRMPVGFSKYTGDPWHSVSGEAIYAHTPGWQIAFPSNAADATGLLRAALRGNDPVFFMEHRALLDTPEGRTPYPGDDFIVPLGQAKVQQTGDILTVVTWGAMLHRCLEAAQPFGDSVEIIDLRTIVPWDRETVLASVEKTGRCLVVHEDTWTAGFGAEIAATIAQDAFVWLDAPIARIAAPDNPVPYNRQLMTTVIPGMEEIRSKMDALLRY